MAEIIYRISSSNDKTVEHKIIISNNDAETVVHSMLSLLRYEWQEEAIEKALRDYLPSWCLPAKPWHLQSS